LKEAGAGNIKLVKSGTTRADVLDGVQGLYNEDYFNRMLSLERKRSQRSKKPFLLMLFDITKLINPHPNLVVISQVGQILEAGIRETDVRGWYRRGHIVGVIFTELESAGESVRDKIFAKILTSLAREIGPEDLKKIEISFHVFPEDHDKGNGTGRFNMNLYKDLLEVERRNGASRKMKRLMDIVGSLLALIIFSPLFLAIAAAIKLTSKAPCSSGRRGSASGVKRSHSSSFARCMSSRRRTPTRNTSRS
jgi:GGDEF domain-containing protein